MFFLAGISFFVLHDPSSHMKSLPQEFFFSLTVALSRRKQLQGDGFIFSFLHCVILQFSQYSWRVWVLFNKFS